MVLPNKVSLFISEFLSTAMLAGFSGMACASLRNDEVSLCMAYGLIHSTLMHCFGLASGAHANPAISLAFWRINALQLNKLAVYVIAQITGALIGHYLAEALLGNGCNDIICKFMTQKEISFVQIICAEFVFTSILIFAWIKAYKGLPIELSVALVNISVCLLSSKWTGASANPVRALILAVFVENTKLSAHLAGQLLAAMVAPLLWKQIKLW